MVLCFDAVLWHHFDKFYWTLDPIREPSPDEEEGSVRERDDDDDEETEGDVLAHVVVSDGERDRERERGRERDRERAAEDEITGHTSGDSGDSIPPPTRRLTKKPSIFELLVENENEHKQGLKSIEMRDNTNRKMRSRFSMIMSSSTLHPYLIFYSHFYFSSSLMLLSCNLIPSYVMCRSSSFSSFSSFNYLIPYFLFATVLYFICILTYFSISIPFFYVFLSYNAF